MPEGTIKNIDAESYNKAIRMGIGKVMEMIDVSVSYSDGHKNKSKSGK